MKILMSGSSGLVGTSLMALLKGEGHDVRPLVRHGTEGVVWDAQTFQLQSPEQLETMDAVVHLAGESIVGRWSDAKKQRILDSRVKSTAALAGALAGLDKKPAVLVVASAVGYYGDRGAEELTEDSAPGKGFLSEVCTAWEAAADAARQAGMRVVHLRFGMLLSPNGGALKAMLTPFKLGIGGKVGSGNQVVSWASLDDAVGAIHHALITESLEGPVNVVSPAPCTNLELTKALGHALSRPTLFPVPAFAARLAFGEMADALLLASQRVIPKKLTESEYTFKHRDLEHTLQELLATP